jgi:hypothetical protein
MSEAISNQGPASTDYIDEAVEVLMRRKRVDHYCWDKWDQYDSSARDNYSPFETAKGKPEHPTPYIVFEKGDPTPVGHSTGNAVNEDVQYAEVLLNFRIYDETKEKCRSAKAVVAAAIESEPLEVTNGCTVDTIIRQSDTLTQDGDDESWVGSITYVAKIEMLFDNLKMRAR